MIKLVYHPDFLKQVKQLPETQQRKLAKLLTKLKSNPYDPQLHTRRLSPPLTGLLAMRVTRDWRATFQFIDERTILLVDVAHRKDIYR